jgi:hypothetical protein
MYQTGADLRYCLLEGLTGSRLNIDSNPTGLNVRTIACPRGGG